MAETSNRLSDLPPAKRALLDKLLHSRSQPAVAELPAAGGPRSGSRSTRTVTGNASHYARAMESMAQAPPGQPALSLTLAGTPEEVKRGYQHFYDAVTVQLDSSIFGEVSFFLNYGYVPTLGPQFATIALPDHFINKTSARLVLEVIGECPLEGRVVLDVGCGRGGTVYVVQTFFNPAQVIGLDLSPAAIAFCRRTHQHPRLSFQQGDAEQLPFDDAGVDVVTNVESSHSYPNVVAFYGEVFRVLKPSGYFLYTDVLATDVWRASIAHLKHLGFILERERDITANVLLSCDEVAHSRVHAFHEGNERRLMQNFLATPESDVYVEMRKRRWTYLILKLRKP